MRRNYEKFESENKDMQKHVDNMYELINQYANEHGIKIAYDDRTEVLVEAIATYLVESSKE